MKSPGQQAAGTGANQMRNAHGGSTLSLIAVFGLSLSDLIEEFLQHLASFWPRLPL